VLEHRSGLIDRSIRRCRRRVITLCQIQIRKPPERTMQLKDQAAIVTGGASGLGANR
jgi:hypothetical protein